jgi:hypothetical protein
MEAGDAGADVQYLRSKATGGEGQAILYVYSTFAHKAGSMAEDACSAAAKRGGGRNKTPAAP